MWTVKVLGVGVVAFALGLEMIIRLVRRLRPGRTLNAVLFFPSEVACVEHIFNPASPR